MSSFALSFDRWKARWLFARQADLWKTFAARRTAGNRRMIVYRNTHFHADPTARIELDSNFHLGCRWDHHCFLPSQLILFADAKLEVRGKFRLFTGCQISVNDGANLILGSGYANSRLNLACFERIEIGERVAIAENVTIRDSDTYSLDPVRSPTAPIRIGDDVWIGLNATILKGVTIGDGAAVAAGAVVIRDVPPRCLVAGVPATVKKENIAWKDRLRKPEAGEFSE